MRLSIPYGRKAVSVDLPDSWNPKLIAPKEMPVIEEPLQALENVFENPLNSNKFDDIFRQKIKIAIVVPDITRKAGIKAILPAVLERLSGIGIAQNRISIIFATGIHPGQTKEQQRAIVGDDIFRDYECIDHDHAGGREAIKTSDGLMVIGSVKLHYLAGYGGGRKAIMPGIATFEECVEFHKLCLDPKDNRRHPKIGQGILAGNPMHKRAMESARTAGVDFIINTVLNADGDFIFVNGGDLEKSFEEACSFIAGYSIVPIGQRADLVIASCGGYPADINFIQSHKSLDSAFRAVKQGGVLFLSAECSEGIGSSEFLKWFERGPSEEMYRALRSNFAINGQTAAATREKTESCRVVFVSSLPPVDVERMGMIPVGGIEEGIELCKKLTAGERPETIAMMSAAETLPQPQ